MENIFKARSSDWSFREGCHLVKMGEPADSQGKLACNGSGWITGVGWLYHFILPDQCKSDPFLP